MKNPRPILGLFIIFLGLSLLFSFPFLKIIFALFVIAMGIRILGGYRGDRDFLQIKKTHESFFKTVVAFSGLNRQIVTDSFLGGEIVVVFGAGEVDMTQTQSKLSVVELNLVAVFGGIKIKVPNNWQVQSEGVGVLGGFSNETKSHNKSILTLQVKGVAFLGGIEVVN